MLVRLREDWRCSGYLALKLSLVDAVTVRCGGFALAEDTYTEVVTNYLILVVYPCTDE